MRFRQLFSISAAVLSCCLAAGDAAGGPVSFGRQLILNKGLEIQSLGFVDSSDDGGYPGGA